VVKFTLPKEYKYNLFISYSDADILFAEKLYKKLLSININVFFENNKYQKASNIWNLFYSSLESSEYNLFIYSENAVKDNDKLGILYKVWTELLGRRKKSITLNMTNKKINPFFKSFYVIESNDIDDTVEELKYILSSTLITKYKKEKITLDKIEKSLFCKLKFDFFISYQYNNNFFYEKYMYDEHIKLLRDNRNHSYYLDYWGLKSAQILSPILFETFYTRASNYINSKLFKNKILEIPIQKVGKDIRTIKSLKQTIWGLEILLLSETNLDFIIDFTNELIFNNQLYRNLDNGWKDFINNDNSSSLLTSLYVFCFLSKIKKHIDLDEEILISTEKFIIGEWKTKKWIFSNLHWFLSTINILINYIPFCINKKEIKVILDEIVDFLEKDILNSEKLYLGLDYYLEPYVFYSRLIYLFKEIRDYFNTDYNEMTNILIDKYEHKTYISNFDIYIITNILIDYY
jgi:hypothetical protein